MSRKSYCERTNHLATHAGTSLSARRPTPLLLIASKRGVLGRGSSKIFGGRMPGAVHAPPASFLERLEERLLSSVLRRVERLEHHMNRWADCCMRFMPREWVEAQGFVWADAVLAAVLLGLVALSYIMLAHMLRSWGDGPMNASSVATTPRAVTARGGAAASGGAAAEVAGGGSGARAAASCAEYGPVHEEIDGMTALMRASSQGDENCAAELIAAGASVDARDSQEGFTALLMASAMGTPAPARPTRTPTRLHPPERPPHAHLFTFDPHVALRAAQGTWAWCAVCSRRRRT